VTNAVARDASGSLGDPADVRATQALERHRDPGEGQVITRGSHGTHPRQAAHGPAVAEAGVDADPAESRLNRRQQRKP